MRYDLVTGQATLVSVRDTAHLDAPSSRRARITAVGVDYDWSPRGHFLTFTAWLDAGPNYIGCLNRDA